MFCILKLMRPLFDCVNNAKGFVVTDFVTFGNQKRLVNFKGVIKLAERDEYLIHYFHFIEVFLGCFCWAEGNVDNIVLDPKLLDIKLIRSVIHSVLPNVKFNVKDFSTDIFVLNDRDLYPKRLMEQRTIQQCVKYTPLFKKQVYDNLGIKPKQKPKRVEDITVTYIFRNPGSKNRYLSNRESLFYEIRKKGVKLQIIKFEDLTYENQVRLVANTDILIGVHGNGLTNLLWLPTHGYVFEFFGSFHHYGYQVLSEITNGGYIGIENKKIYNKGTRSGGAHGKAEDPVTLDIQIFLKEFNMVIKNLIF